MRVYIQPHLLPIYVQRIGNHQYNFTDDIVSIWSNEHSLRKVGTYLALAIILLAIAALPYFTKVDAAKVKSVKFTQESIEIAPGHFDAVDSTTTCPDGSVREGAFLGLTPRAEGNSVTGSWFLQLEEGAAAADGGNVKSLQVSNSKFRVGANWNQPPGTQPIVCENSATIPANVIITGPCGNDKTVTLVASNGVKGIYKGDVTCSK
jgi:hypothetical protein